MKKVFNRREINAARGPRASEASPREKKKHLEKIAFLDKYFVHQEKRG